LPHQKTSLPREVFCIFLVPLKFLRTIVASYGLCQRIDNAFVVHVSPVSLWEIARKVAKGVLKLPLEPQEWFARVKEQHNLTLVPLSEAVAFKAATLPEIHKDPADRFLIATAIENKLAIVTADNIIPQYGVECFC